MNISSPPRIRSHLRSISTTGRWSLSSYSKMGRSQSSSDSGHQFAVSLSRLAQFFSFQWDNLWSETALFHFKIAILPPKSAPIWIILWLKVRKFIRDSDFSNRPKLSPLFEPLNWRKLTPIKAKNAANANQNKCSHTNSHTKNGKVTLGKSWFWTTKSWWTTFLD